LLQELGLRELEQMGKNAPFLEVNGTTVDCLDNPAELS